MNFTQRDDVRRAAAVLADVGMLLPGLAFIQTNSTLSGLYLLVGVSAAVTVVSNPARTFVYDHRAAVFAAFSLLTALVFLFVVGVVP